MKTAFGILLLAFLLASCSQKPVPADPRLNLFESRIAALESNVAELTIRANNNSNLVSNLLNPGRIDPATGLPTTNNPDLTIDPATGLPILETDLRLSKLETLYSNLVMTLNMKASAPNPPPAPATQDSSSGVPADVMAQIRADAAKEFPNNYDEQVYIINQQVDAWNKLHQ